MSCFMSHLAALIAAYPARVSFQAKPLAECFDRKPLWLSTPTWAAPEREAGALDTTGALEEATSTKAAAGVVVVGAGASVVGAGA